MSDNFHISRRNKVRQIATKAAYDRTTVHAILAAGQFANVGFIDNDGPVVVPMIYGRDGETLYLHGARKARVIRLLEQTETICINVTLLDALVLARSAFNSSMNYRSVTVFGKPQLIDDRAGKLHALHTISEHLMPGRWAELRAPLEREIRMTGVIAVAIETASAKISAGMPDDEPEDYTLDIWAGILPAVTEFKTLQPDVRLATNATPSAVVKALQNRSL